MGRRHVFAQNDGRLSIERTKIDMLVRMRIRMRDYGSFFALWKGEKYIINQ